MKPNKHGVYPKDQAITISFSDGKRFDMQIHALELKPDQWISAICYNFNCGSYEGQSSPLSVHPNTVFYESYEDAIKPHINHMIKRFRCLTEGGVERLSSAHSLEQLSSMKVMVKQLQEFAGLPDETGQQQLFSMS